MLEIKQHAASMVTLKVIEQLRQIVQKNNEQKVGAL